MRVSIAPPEGIEDRSAFGDLGERERRNDHRPGEILPAGVGVAASEFVAVGKADAMDQKIEAAPGRRQLGKHRLDRGQILDVASVDMIRGAEFFGERRDPLAKRVVLIGEGEIGAFCGQSLGYAPGDRVIIRDAHHQAAFAAH